jgi:hypothetical protein
MESGSLPIIKDNGAPGSLHPLLKVQQNQPLTLMWQSNQQKPG